jgi:hypothetical protein
VFSHAGDLGDLLYHLPAIRRLCCDVPSELVLYPTNIVREAWTPAKVERVRSFLELQPYIERVRYADRPEGVVMDGWRRRHYPRGLNLVDMATTWARVPHWDVRTPWAVVDRPVRVAKYVFHRSPRYNTETFPWGEIVREYGPEAVFIGGPEEHAAFTERFGPVTYHPTETLLDLARVISACELFCGGQSAPRALAEALKVPVWVEEDPRIPNTRFARPNARYNGAFTSCASCPR